MGVEERAGVLGGSMAELMAIAGAILSDASRVVETSAQNVANITTPGYKRRTDFSRLMDPTAVDGETAAAYRSRYA